jgi:hypothetical protein
MADALYRIEPREEIRIMSMSELLSAKFATEPAPEPDCQFTPRGEWYCNAEECVVREVTISAKLYGESMPDLMRCPACGEALEFHHWLRDVTLLEVTPCE